VLVTAIEGVVENGKIRLSEDVHLAENTRVYVIVADMKQQPESQVRTPRLANSNQLKDFRKQVLEIPSSPRQEWSQQ
jgi:hypothetical protein